MNRKVVAAPLGEQALALLDAERNEELHEWMTQSEEHVREVILIAFPQQAARNFSPATREAMLELLTPEPVGDAEAHTPLPWWKLPSSLVRPLVGVVAAAAVLAVFVVGLGLIGSNEWQHYETKFGQSYVVALPDRTQVRLNTETQLEVRYSPSMREVRLTQGEAIFDVAPNPSRPFVVESERVRVRAVGTQFDVRLGASYVGVAVSHGLVAVSYHGQEGGSPPLAEQKLAAGAGLHVTNSGSMNPMTPSQYVNATQWDRAPFEFNNDELGYMAGEFNRYNEKPKIRIDGAAAHTRFSGVFDRQSPERLIALVAADPSYDVKKVGDQTVIRLRKEPDKK